MNIVPDERHDSSGVFSAVPEPLRVELARLREENERLRKEAESVAAANAYAAEALAKLEAVRTVSEEITRELDLQPLLSLITRRAVELVEAESGAAHLWDEAAQVVIPQAWHGQLAAWQTEIRYRPGEGVVGTVAARRVGLIVNDYRRSVYAHPLFLERTDMAAVLAEPLLYQDRFLGVIALTRGAARPFAEHDQGLLRLFAAQAATALENARLHTAAVRRGEEMGALLRATRSVMSGLDLQGILDRILVETVQITGCSHVKVLLVDKKAGVLRVGAIQGTAMLEGDRLPLGVGHSGIVAATGQALFSEDAPNDPQNAYGERDRELGIVTYLGLPIKSRGEILGVLSFNTTTPRRYSEAELAYLTSFADHAAIAIENARLYQETAARQQQFATLVQVAQRLTRGLDLTTVLAAIAEAAATLFQGEAGFRLLEGDFLVRKWVTAGAKQVMARERLRVGESLSGQVAASGKAIVTSDALTDPRLVPEHRAGTQAAGTGALLCLPIRVEGRLLGTLHVFRERGHVFDETAMALASSLADQAGIAIENARLFAELNDSYVHLQKAQAELVRSEKLRGLGQMAAGIAHELNNTLATILGQVDRLKLCGAPPEVREGLDILETAATDGAHVVRRLQDFSRQRSASPLAPMDLCQAVQEALEITRPRWQNDLQQQGKTIDVHVALEDLPRILGHAPEVREALTNLIFNAVDAMRDGGTLTFVGAAGPEGVSLRVMDTGVGMPESVRQKVFEPFFTTKGVQGTGLGLSVVYGIMERHGGRIEVNSSPGKGTTFTLRFQTAPQEKKGGPEAGRPLETSPRRLLLIDDDKTVRTTLASLLRAVGHEVIEASRGAEGMSCLAQRPVDMVITDLGMPEMTGWEVAQRVKREYPQVPVVLLTGWGQPLVDGSPEQVSVDRVLEKPIRLEELQDVIARLTARARGPERE